MFYTCAELGVSILYSYVNFRNYRTIKYNEKIQVKGELLFRSTQKENS